MTSQEGSNRGEVFVPENSTLVLTGSAYALDGLTFDRNSTLIFSGVQSANLTCQKLTLLGPCTIDLTPKVPAPSKPTTPRGQPQAGNDPAPQNGARGIDGTPGGDGVPGINLNMSVQSVDGSGSLWIKIDGTPGGSGGDGGSGGKGSSGPQTCASNPDGGAGGDGGNGGCGGKGGDTAKVILKLGENTISPTKADGVAPSSRPTDIPGAIQISGSPGRGGAGGQGGAGGPGGEGHQSHFPCPTSDSQDGAHGNSGPNGQDGILGNFIPLHQTAR